LTLPASFSKVGVTGQSSKSLEENVAKVVDATSSDGCSGSVDCCCQKSASEIGDDLIGFVAVDQPRSAGC